MSKQQNKNNVILVDWRSGQDWNFLKRLESATSLKWFVLGVDACKKRSGKIDKLVNIYAKYFVFPLKVFFIRNRYDRVLAWQQFFGIFLAFYCFLFKVKTYPKIYVLTFIYKEKKGVLKNIYFKFINNVIKSKYVYKLICFSLKERDYYIKEFNLSHDKIIYIPYGIESIENKEVFTKTTNNNYFLSVGRSNRDYDFLIKEFKDFNEELIILCDELETVKVANITILNNVFENEYLEYLANCYAIIISLKDENISSGQLVFLRAMEFGKPIIITKNNAITDYLIDGYNSIVIEKNKNSLLESIFKLKNDKELYNRLILNGKKTFHDYYSMEKFSEAVSSIINNDLLKDCSEIFDKN